MSQGPVGRYSVHATALHAQYCPFQTHLHTNVPPVLYSCFQQLLRGVQTRKPGVYRAHSYTRQRLVALTPFQPTACLCIPLCINSVVLQALRERYNASR